MDYSAIRQRLEQLSETGAGSDELAQLYRAWLRIKDGVHSSMWPAVESRLTALGRCPLVHLSVTGWQDNRIQAISLWGDCDSGLQYRDVFIPADEFEDFVGDCQGWDDITLRSDRGMALSTATTTFQKGQSVIVSMLDTTWAQWLEAYETQGLEEGAMDDIWNLLAQV